MPIENNKSLLHAGSTTTHHPPPCLGMHLPNANASLSIVCMQVARDECLTTHFTLVTTL